MASAVCTQCGLTSPLSGESCPSCGGELRSVTQPGATSLSHAELNSNQTRFGRIQPGVQIGNALEVTLSLFAKNIWVITKLVFLLFAPLEVFKVLSLDAGNRDLQAFMGATLLSVVCHCLIAPTVIYSLYKQLQTDAAPPLTESYRWGLSRLWKIIVVTIISGLLIGFGFILLVIPGIIAMIGLYVVYPIAALEDRTAINVLERSWNLTKGYRWRIFAIVVVLLLISLVLNTLIGVVLGIVTTTFVGAIPSSMDMVWPVYAGGAVALDIFNVVSTVATLVVYLSIIQSQPPELVNET